MEILYVKHENWFEIEIDGINYRCRFTNRGLTYASIEITKINKIRKRKFGFFGPEVEVIQYEKVTDFDIDGRNIVIQRKQFYLAEGTRVLVNELLNSYHERINKKHSYKI